MKYMHQSMITVAITGPLGAALLTRDFGDVAGRAVEGDRRRRLATANVHGGAAKGLPTDSMA